MGRQSVRERVSEREGDKVRHFSITFVSQNDQLNRLPPADFKNLNNLAWSEFCRHYTEKISPFTLTIFL